MNLVIFTDLDGSLLNHDDYSYDGAKAAIARISGNHIPMVMVTSKTRGEVEEIQYGMGLNEPFIVENGGGIFFPAGYRGWAIEQGRSVNGYRVIELGVAYGLIRTFVAEFSESFGFKGFGDWSIAEIAARTGLAEDQAALAGQREFTEPFSLGMDADLDALHSLAMKHGLKITKGGRFYHLLGAGQDKGVAVKKTCTIFCQHMATKPLTVGIGDSENDLPMLGQVDIPVLIPRPDGSRLDIELPRLVIADQPGSKGWGRVMEKILDGCTRGSCRDF